MEVEKSILLEFLIMLGDHIGEKTGFIVEKDKKNYCSFSPTAAQAYDQQILLWFGEDPEIGEFLNFPLLFQVWLMCKQCYFGSFV